MKRRLLIGLTLLLMVTTCWSFSPIQAGQLDLQAAAAILIDYTTGEVLYQKNIHQRQFPASTTKILTALLALERGELKQTITTGPQATKVGGSSIYLANGERHSLEELLYGILLSSGNDASVAVAEGLAGSETKFAEWMNIKARAIGANDSNFKNSNGMPDLKHYTTAYDLALITRYALHNPVFSGIVRTKQKVIPWPGHKTDRVMINHNKMLWRYQFADGVKTGYTRQAGKCLVSSATKDNQRLIAVVLNSKQTYEDSQKLFEYGFNNYQLIKVVSPETEVGKVNVSQGVVPQVPILPNQTINLVIPRKDSAELQVNLDYPKSIAAPVERLQQVGEVEVKLGEELLERVPLVTAAAVPERSFWQKVWVWFKDLLQNSNYA